MHDSARRFITACAENCGPGPVLDVGGLNVNGSARDLFPGREYTALDMREGPGVDWTPPQWIERFGYA